MNLISGGTMAVLKWSDSVETKRVGRFLFGGRLVSGDELGRTTEETLVGVCIQ